MITELDYTKFHDIELYGNLATPSTVHGYSLAIEYMKKWFLDKFEDDYFKTIYINGKHVFDDQRKDNKKITIEKPAIAITPAVNYEFDRDTLDLYLGGRDIISRRSTYYQDAFFQDHSKNIYLGIKLRQLEMPFNFRIRVSSKAQQIDLYEYMKLAFRVKATQGEYLSMDFHIPYNIMMEIATSSGFEIITDDRNKRVKDIIGFLNYLNSNSKLPFLYKYRCINGNSEFFIRLNNVYVHISNLDDLQLDDGDKQGQIDNNFHIELSTILQIPIPHFYYFYSDKSLQFKYKEENKLYGLYAFNDIEPPNKNEKDWDQYLSTEYSEESLYLETIEFKELLENKELMKIIKLTVDTGLSPSVFMDIKIYNALNQIPITIDWENYIININQKIREPRSKITIYTDLKYINDKLAMLQDANNTRIS